MKVVRLIVSLVMVVGVAVVGCLMALGVGDGEAAEELASLRSAPACLRPPQAPAACTWEGVFEFVGSDRHPGGRGSDWYSIDLRDTRLAPDGGPGFVQSVSSFDLADIDGLTYDTRVPATLWHGRIIEVRIDGRAIPTDDYPMTVAGPRTPARRVVVVLCTVAFVALGALLSIHRFRRARAAARNRSAGD